MTFLPNRDFEGIANFIYNKAITNVEFTFDRIENPDGTFRSPKIKAGGRDAVSVVTVIREHCRLNPADYDWYLIWFGLESEELESEQVVFYLFNNQSDDYQQVSRIIDLNRNGRIENTDQQFSVLIKYLDDLVNKTSEKIIEELEIDSQLGFSTKFKPFDLEKANQRLKVTGRLGEELVDKYLNSLKANGQIFNYSWFNKDFENGLAYDFTIQENNQNIIHLDVKSTISTFEQPMFFSGQEIDFITTTPNYSIYRVYNLKDTANPRLRICNNSKAFVSTLIPHISEFRKNLQALNVTPSAKFAIPPTIDDLTFNAEINL